MKAYLKKSVLKRDGGEREEVKCGLKADVTQWWRSQCSSWGLGRWKGILPAGCICIESRYSVDVVSED